MRPMSFVTVSYETSFERTSRKRINPSSRARDRGGPHDHVTLVVGVSMDGARIPMTRDRVVRVAQATLRAERVTAALLSITFVGNAVMRRMNRKHLRRTGDTDVITFAFRPMSKGAPLVGDVYIAPEVAKQSAKTNRVSVREEIV